MSSSIPVSASELSLDVSKLTMASDSPQLPVELLYAIVSLVVVKYLDDLIAGPLALPPVDISENDAVVRALLALDSQITLSATLDTAIQAIGEEEKICLSADAELEKNNPLIPLLRASTQVRATTLQVISDVLGIGLVKDGIPRYVYIIIHRSYEKLIPQCMARGSRLTSKPWARIQIIRHLYAKPHLYYYLEREHDFKPFLCSSGLIATYAVISHDNAMLQIKRCRLKTRDGRRNPNLSILLKSMRGYVTSPASALPLNLSIGVINQFAQIQMVLRTVFWTMEVQRCACLFAFF